MQHLADNRVAARELATAMADGCIGVRVSRLQRIVARHFDQALRPIGLSIPQMEILGTLTIMSGPVRPAALADALAVERSTMSRNLAAMEAAGLITTAERSATGRSMAVGITEAGTRALAHARTAWESAQAQVLATLGDEAVPTLDVWLGGLTR